MEKENIEKLVEDYGDMLFRCCLIMLGNASDAEDAVQETYLKYLRKQPALHDEEHRKAWLLKTAANQCRDMLRFRKRHPEEAIDEVHAYARDTQNPQILDALMRLDSRYRSVLVLHYVEGYSVHEIAGMIRRTDSAVKMRLKKGRDLLKEAYRKEDI